MLFGYDIFGLVNMHHRCVFQQDPLRGVWVKCWVKCFEGVECRLAGRYCFIMIMIMIDNVRFIDGGASYCFPLALDGIILFIFICLSVRLYACISFCLFVLLFACRFLYLFSYISIVY